ncbi:MAG: hypothetical protein ACC682_11365 [Gemmatimonadota bacterium]
MKLRTTHPLCAVILGAFALPHPAVAQSGPEIAREALARYSDRVANVNEYTLVQEINGTRATAHFEKRVVDGNTTFVSISAFTVIQEALDKQRTGILLAMVQANLGGASLEPELSSAPYGQLKNFLGAAGEISSSVLGGGLDGGVAGALGSEAPLDAVRDILVRAAVRTGLEQVAGALGGSTEGQMAQLAGALAGLGDESILGQLGKIALGELKSVALEKLAGALGGPLASTATSLLSGGGLEGLADKFGSAGRPGSAMAPQAAGGLAQAGLSALMGGAGMLALDAIMPDLDELDLPTDRMRGPDAYEVLRVAGPSLRVTGSEKIDGNDTWVLEVVDLAGLDLPEAEEFDPTGITLRLDKAQYVVRRTVVSGDLEMEGETIPISMETRLEDYREVDGLLYPFRTVSLIRGMQAAITDEERAEFEQLLPVLQEQMKEMEKQLAQIPPEQRAMVEQLMQQRMPQQEQSFKQLEAMVAAEPTEIVVEVVELRVNQGRPESLRPINLRPPS